MVRAPSLAAALHCAYHRSPQALRARVQAMRRRPPPLAAAALLLLLSAAAVHHVDAAYGDFCGTHKVCVQGVGMLCGTH